MHTAKTFSTALAVLLIQTISANAWTSSFTNAESLEGDDTLKVTVRSTSGNATITFVCAEGTIGGYLVNTQGANLKVLERSTLAARKSGRMATAPN